MTALRIPVLAWFVSARKLVRLAARTTAVAVVLPILALLSDVTGVASSVFGCSFPDWEDGCRSHLVGLLRPAVRLPRSDPLPLDQFIVPVGPADAIQLFVGSTHGSTLRRLPTLTSRSFASPSLTQDRRSIVYVDSGGDVRTMAADGTRDRLLMHTPQGCGRIRHVSLNFAKPRFLVVECRQERTRGSLVVVDTHGQIVRTLAVGLERVDDPNVSPDGKRVLYWASADLSTKNNGGAIYSVPFDGSEEGTNLSDSRPGIDADPTFSPDGSTIAFRRRMHPGDYDIWLMAADGTRQRPLLTREGLDQKPAWSPDGTSLLAVHQPPKGRGDPGLKNLVQVDVASGRRADLTIEGPDVLTPVWWHR